MPAALASKIAAEALALRRSHPQAPARDILDLVMTDREAWLEDFFDLLEPPAPFALLVAEAMGDFMRPVDWQALTGPQASEELRQALREDYKTSVRSKFLRRYGWTPECLLAGTQPKHLRSL